jgi:hypothetical protein
MARSRDRNVTECASVLWFISFIRSEECQAALPKKEVKEKKKLTSEEKKKADERRK